MYQIYGFKACDNVTANLKSEHVGNVLASHANTGTTPAQHALLPIFMNLGAKLQTSDYIVQGLPSFWCLLARSNMVCLTLRSITVTLFMAVTSTHTQHCRMF